MGDRANVVIREGAEEVWLYTHWGGDALPETVRAALARGQGRWDDPQYLTRIVFDQMKGDDVKGETGFGIWASIGDNEHEIIVVDTKKQRVEIYGSDNEKAMGEMLRSYTIAEYAESGDAAKPSDEDD